MATQNAFRLSDDVTIPAPGLGTWRIDAADTARVVREALEIGYRHIDTAQAYGNEAGVGEGVRASGLPRDSVFITTKLAAESKSHDDARARIDASLAALQMDHIDLMLIHSPQPWSAFRQQERYFEGNLEAWRALEEAVEAGKIRAIGVSNFEAVDLDNLFAHGRIRPQVNQILAHIGNIPDDLIAESRRRGMLVEAYSPVAHGAVLKNERMLAMAGKYGVGVAQLCIRFCLQLGLLPLPKSTSAEHLRENFAVDFEISDADMALLQRSGGDTDYGEAQAFPVFGIRREPASGSDRNRGDGSGEGDGK